MLENVKTALGITGAYNGKTSYAGMCLAILLFL